MIPHRQSIHSEPSVIPYVNYLAPFSRDTETCTGQRNDSVVS
jgi:hypothetical protein